MVVRCLGRGLLAHLQAGQEQTIASMSQSICGHYIYLLATYSIGFTPGLCILTVPQVLFRSSGEDLIPLRHNTVVEHHEIHPKEPPLILAY